MMVKKVLKAVAIVLVLAFVAVQFVGIDTANPPIERDQTLEATTSVPPDISLILGRSCNDCHSNQTMYPWYAHIQPLGWFLKSHIDDGRRRLNFSVWNTYDATKKAKRLEDICEQVESKEMPLPSYLWLHGGAALSDSETRALCDWTKVEAAKIIL